MDRTNPLNVTTGGKVLLVVAGLLLWGIGGTIDGASLRSLVSVPIFVALWMGLVWAIDRWVRSGAVEPPPAPHQATVIDAAARFADRARRSS